MLHRAARAAAPAYTELCEQVRNAPVVTPDETGWRVGGVRHWLWTFVTRRSTPFAGRRCDAARPAPDRWSPPPRCGPTAAGGRGLVADRTHPQPRRVPLEQRGHRRGAPPPHLIQETLLGAGIRGIRSAGIVQRRGHAVPGRRARPRRAVGRDAAVAVLDRGCALVGSLHVVPSRVCDRFPLKSRPSVRTTVPVALHNGRTIWPIEPMIGRPNPVPRRSAASESLTARIALSPGRVFLTRRPGVRPRGAHRQDERWNVRATCLSARVYWRITR